jgi:hypothetical protein
VYGGRGRVFATLVPAFALLEENEGMMEIDKKMQKLSFEMTPFKKKRHMRFFSAPCPFLSRPREGSLPPPQ